jgi:hypothetical protein
VDLTIVVAAMPIVVGALLGVFAGRNPVAWRLALSMVLLFLAHTVVGSLAGMAEYLTQMRVLEMSGVAGWLAFAVALFITRRKHALRPSGSGEPDSRPT